MYTVPDMYGYLGWFHIFVTMGDYGLRHSKLDDLHMYMFIDARPTVLCWIFVYSFYFLN